MTEETQLIRHTEPATPEGYLAPGGEPRLSIRDKIASKANHAQKVIHVDEWDVDILMKSLTLGERNDMLKKAKGDGNGDADISIIYPEMIMRCSYNPEEPTEHVFADDDAAFINSLPANLMDKLAIPAMELSGMSEKALDDAGKESSETAS